MYHSSITQRHLELVESTLKLRLHRYTPVESLALSQALLRLKKEDGSWSRPLKPYEWGFIRNERILCQLDFEYFTRYVNLILDSGGIGSLSLWESQRILLDHIAKLELRNIDMQSRGEKCDGILIADHKGGRQLGHTAIARSLIWHRLLLQPYTRAATIAVDEPGVHKIYEKDELIYTGLPFFLLPNQSTGRFLREKDQHWNFMDLGSNLTYYQAQQRAGIGTGIGTGATYDISHGTEVSTYAYPDMLELDFFPTLPQNPYTLCVLETTAFGRGNWWHTFSEACRKGKKLRWSYLFIPFYAEPSKYRRTPPTSWTPNSDTVLMAKKVEETSPEFTGKKVVLAREQMYWWESSVNEAKESHALNKFLSNYSITPEDSFQHSSLSALPAELLMWMRSTTRTGMPYELEVV